MRCMKNFLVLLCLLLTGCSHETRYAGVVVRQTDLKQLRVNESKITDIFKALGSPTFISIEDPKHLLHYASCCMKIAPSRASTVQSLLIYTLRVDDKGVLRDIKQTSSLRDISFDKSSTPAVFKRASFIEEFLASSAARFK